MTTLALTSKDTRLSFVMTSAILKPKGLCQAILWPALRSGLDVTLFAVAILWRVIALFG